MTVAKKFTEPSPEELERIQQDKTVKQDVFRHTDPKREWSGKFRAPVDARISDVFGTRRTFNGKVQSMHQGLDYAVPQGTPISATNAGTVLLASPLYFEGNCVVLDHGQGLLTLYLHMSEIKVKAGDRVKRGQELGLSGGTGRATGPHLHLAVRWQGVYLNPATLLNPTSFRKTGTQSGCRDVACYVSRYQPDVTTYVSTENPYSRPSVGLDDPLCEAGRERIGVRRFRFLTSRCR